MNVRLAITMGDVNGVGPEVLAKTLAGRGRGETAILVIGDAAVLESQLVHAPNLPMVVRVASAADWESTHDSVAVWDAGHPAPAPEPGVLSPAAGKCAMEWVRAAVALAQSGVVDGIVTCPINKEGIHRAGYECKGHTDFIADLTGSPDYRMSLFAGPMRVVHVSGHLPLREAIDTLSRERIVETVHIADDALRRLGAGRRIAVAGLNPHAGEAGLLGTEEADIVVPAIADCVASGIACTGPHSPDAVFRHLREGRYDLVVALYHDQGHIPMKLIAMDEGVNVTLGLPIVRTSVDHGTAYDIAGKGQARPHSLEAAIQLAAALAPRGAHRAV